MANEALIVIDVQNDFCPDGALAVAGGDQVVPVINALIGRFEHVVLTQDWHPAGHSSFASSHPGKAPFETVEMAYGTQTLWPDHCVQGTAGAAFHPELEWTSAEMIIRKGFRKAIDSYSAFFENDHETPTGLSGYLRERGISRVTLAGLATDFCVAYSALDARRQGFDATVILEGCRAIDLGGSLATMTAKMKEAGVTLS
ncbi:isochorismatase hydrolase [Nitratireductor indicus C115]|uniref:Nicotinamidase n=1 Tax=Nitratireductor indicus C115 TaxID=1231190 RepID=K2NZ63_9HYPH|nr:bifunctional nicotinamidase/pyrazinamidase [Nitratireductor indicus]EKF40391.1 isochorismatase hydrolase [Nitratireductor indicus C115]SFQ77415.1 nicotinamidase/pyrazinamidase [Nitratireductor indicus]